MAQLFSALIILCLRSRAAAFSQLPCLAELSDIVVTPSSNRSLWDQSHNVSSPEWDGRLPGRPAFVALPRSVNDVQRCLRCAVQHKLQVAVNGGGHSFGGYSTVPANQNGFMINMKFMASTSDIGACEPGGVSTVNVQAGANWFDVYHSFARSGKEWVVNGGLCPTVGVAGFTMGGGAGPAARMHGLGLDAVLNFTMVTADGKRVVVANKTSNADLFWALRGGGGGNFGVVTDLTLQIHPGPSLYTFGEVCFAWDQVEKLLQAVQHYDDRIPREVNLDMVIGHHKDGGSCLWVTSMKSLELTRQALSPILQALAPATAKKDTLKEWDCYWHGICHFATEKGYSKYNDDPFYSKNCLLDYFTPELAPTLVNLTDAAPENCGGQHFIAFGGKVNDIAPDATAFPWRSTKYMVYASCGYKVSDSLSRKLAKDYLDVWASKVFPFCNGGSYVNFIDPLATDVDRYYGQALPKLKAIKRSWSPSGFNPLHFPMQIPAEPQDSSVDDTLLHI